MSDAKTIFDKIWETHVVAQRDDGECLLYICLLYTSDAADE